MAILNKIPPREMASYVLFYQLKRDAVIPVDLILRSNFLGLTRFGLCIKTLDQFQDVSGRFVILEQLPQKGANAAHEDTNVFVIIPFRLFLIQGGKVGDFFCLKK